jgi:uncharacterized repeat protein (TIGR03803 family)
MRKNVLVLTLLGATLALAFSGVSSAATPIVLHSFSGPDGEVPAAPLIQGADGYFYGITPYGGDFTVLPPDGAGTVFRMDASGNVTSLHVFRGPEGAVPVNLIQARDGYFYGVASRGGQATISSLDPGYGTVFRMDAFGTVTVLRTFPVNTAAAVPGPIMQGADGALYGTVRGPFRSSTHYPGYVYRLDPLTGDFRHLHDFVISDGENPTGKLFQTGDGFFYGTTNQGGPWNAGVVYKVDVAGNFVLLHALSPLWPGDGSDSKSGVIQASDGYFYGTTESGYGGIFRMDAAGNFTVVHRFDPYASDGWRPVSGLTEGRDGFLYGTAPSGGRTILAPSAYGVVYRLATSGEFELLHSFSGPDGNRPIAGLLQAADGMLYGTTALGGAFGLGVVFRIETAPVAPVPLPPLFGLAFDPWTVTGGQSATGWVRLGGPAPLGGAVVTLSTSSSLVFVPATVTVPNGAWTASFTVSTEPVKKTKTATVTARYNGGSVSATLNITR